MTTMTRDQVLEMVREAEDAAERADLRGARLGGVNLSDAYLGYADFTGADFTNADLTEATLYNSDLIRANLRGANLTGANLTRAHLIGADLTNANLTGANLTGANLRGARTPRGQLLDTRGLRPRGPELYLATWDELLPTNPEQRRLVEHLLNDGWGGTLREAIATVEGLVGR